jgi:phenylacetic acid degradation operon negative regulatory protein
VAEHATSFRARVGAMAGLSALVSRAWDLSGLVDRYEAFQSEFSPFLAGRVRAGLSDAEAFLVRTRLVHQFRGFPLLDPELPEEMAAMSHPREQAVDTFHELYAALAEPSQRHFEAVTAAYEVVLG